MFEENDRYLSLATAPSAQAAARRIRRMHTEDEAAAAAARPAARASLPLVAEQRA